MLGVILPLIGRIFNPFDNQTEYYTFSDFSNTTHTSKHAFIENMWT